MKNNSNELFGLPPLINAAGTLTKLGGCRMRPEAAQAMADASRHFIGFADLQKESGRRIAELLGVESALVTAGAASALTQAAAACMAGIDEVQRSQLPQGAHRNEIIIMRSHRNPYDQAMRMAGAKFIEIGSAIETHAWELDGAINDKSAAVAFFLQSEMYEGSLGLKNTIDISHRNNIPVIIDAAAELPPKSNLWSIAQEGGDLVIFSGGKDIRGPQTSGLMVGRRDLVAAAAFHTAPNYGVARPMKAGKEIVAGLVKALELYLEEDEDARFERWNAQSGRLIEALSSIPLLQVKAYTPSQPRIQPSVIPRIKVRIREASNRTVDSIIKDLLTGEPPIVVDRSGDAIVLNVHFIEEQEVDVLISRFKSVMEVK